MTQTEKEITITKIPSKEIPKQRFAYDSEGNFMGPHVGTESDFSNWMVSGWVEGPEPPKTISRDQVNTERDRRVSSGLPFNSSVFDFDQRGKDNITGAASLAKFAVLAGAQPGDYKWHVTDPANKDSAQPFSWITQDNSLVLLDAQTTSSLGDAAANWETVHVFAARSLKEMSPIPLDFEDDKYWPTG